MSPWAHGSMGPWASRPYHPPGPGLFGDFDGPHVHFRGFGGSHVSRWRFSRLACFPRRGVRRVRGLALTVFAVLAVFADLAVLAVCGFSGFGGFGGRLWPRPGVLMATVKAVTDCRCHDHSNCHGHGWAMVVATIMVGRNFNCF